MARRLKILLVDDQSDDARLFSLGVETSHPATGVSWVGDGQDAIDYLTGQGPYRDRERFPLPDLIVMDLRMNRIDGFQFLAWLRDSPYACIPAVIWTGSLDPKDLEKGLALGATRIFHKPVRFEELLGIIGQICAHGRTLQNDPATHSAG